MTPLMQQFLSESRECLQGIGEQLMRLERTPTDPELMTSLFRLVHTLKGNSGLFEFREMSRVLHAGEDLLDAVRQGRVGYSRELADRLLDAMDFVGMLCDEIEATGAVGANHANDSARLAESLRALLAACAPIAGDDDGTAVAHGVSALAPENAARDLARDVAIAARMPAGVSAAMRVQQREGVTLHWVHYTPDEQCFFQGDDPLHQSLGTPGLLWGCVIAREEWPALATMDAYRCMLDLHLLTSASREELEAHFRYVPDQVRVEQAPASTVDAAASPDVALIAALVDVQRGVLHLPMTEPWHLGRLRAASSALAGCARSADRAPSLGDLASSTEQCVRDGSGAALLDWVARVFPVASTTETRIEAHLPTPSDAEAEVRFGRRSEDATTAAKSLRVDQAKIDRLMNLIGEMVVSKNALPYLAARAETVFGSRELSREIRAQYAVINRIAEEMQDAILQVCMMPVSFVFQRFPRLVRDTARALGKDVRLVLDGEDTEADKRIIEALSDPLVHIVRNSLDHGFELPAVRVAAGKPASGTLTIRASQVSDRVVIEIRDDGKGIDPAVIRRKAYEKGVIDEAALERLTDQEAVNLIFTAGFSTMDAVSDLSGRGVGMDVVRTAIATVNGSVAIESELGKGTTIRLSLPMSMAVTSVMLVETDGRTLGVPMESIVETVRVPRASIHAVKHAQATVLRGRIVPLRAINEVLALGAPSRANADDELAVLVIHTAQGIMGLIVDEFRGTADVILKPMTGVLAGLTVYAGSALMGDGTVLMILNTRELC